MIVTFADQGTKDVFNGESTRRARATCPQEIWKVARRKLMQLDSVVRLDELRVPPSNRFEALKGKRRGEYSIRINDQYRLCFHWGDTGPYDVRVEDYH